MLMQGIGRRFWEPIKISVLSTFPVLSFFSFPLLPAPVRLRPSLLLPLLILPGPVLLLPQPLLAGPVLSGPLLAEPLILLAAVVSAVGCRCRSMRYLC